MALGITAILMIVVTGLSVMYMREFKLSRLSYDEVLSSASSEGMFEYGMLKIRNHADGFEDTVDSSLQDLDTEMFKMTMPRSAWMEMKYEILAQTGSYSTKIEKNGFLVIPLFAGTDEVLSNKSLKPLKWDETKPSTGLAVSGLNADSSWTITAMNGQQSVALQGSGANARDSKGSIELKAYLCSYVVGDNVEKFDSDEPCAESSNPKKTAYNSASENQKEELLYVYRIENVSVKDFLDSSKEEFGTGDQKTKLKRDFPYLIVYNNQNADLSGVQVTADSPFTLPKYQVTATATKGDASQVFRFSEDKSRVYDALKYGYYGTEDL